MSGGRERVVVLGAGLAGLACAWKLSERGDRHVLVLEKAAQVGGLASTVAFDGWRFDIGSHRIHPAYFPEALELLRRLLGDELLRVPRRGRLRLNGRYVTYPPSLADFVGALGPAETARCAASLVAGRARGLFRKRRETPDTYEEYLRGLVGRRAYTIFYAPYARKLYGIDPRQVSLKAAKVRVTTARPLSVARAIVARWLGARPASKGYFYYPARGFGSIADALWREAAARGARLQTGVRVRELRAGARGIREMVVEWGGSTTALPVDAVVSTIPMEQLLALIRPEAPSAIREAAAALRWRGIRLLQVVLARPRCLDGETYYFPEEAYLFGRISEPAQYSSRLRQSDAETALNIEVIGSPGDALWSLDEPAFFERILADAASIGLFRRDEVRAYRSLRVPVVYPVYDAAFERHRDAVLEWLESRGDLYSIGRGGMFLHGSTDHSIYLGLRLAAHLAQDGARSEGWRAALAGDDFRVWD